MNEFVQRKLDVAKRLATGECGGDTGDAIIVISALLSSMAAVLWPKKDRTDRRRFVELWARYADPPLRPNLISLPMLVEHLKEREMDDAAEAVRSLRPSLIDAVPEFDDRVVSGLSVDVTDSAVAEVARLPVADIRKFSYAELFYRHFRSGYIHEYQVGSHGDAFRMSDLKDAVVYDGAWEEPPHRRIQFDIQWIIEIARTVTANVAGDWSKRPLDLPRVWWIDGAQ